MRTHVVACAALTVCFTSGCFDLLGGRRDQHRGCGDECRSDWDCPRGTVCFEWTCHPGCLRDWECGRGRICEGFICHDVESRPPAPPPEPPPPSPPPVSGLDPDAGVVFRRDGGPPAPDAGVSEADAGP